MAPAWSLANGSPLTETEIDDLVTYFFATSKANPVIQVSPSAPTPSQPGNPALSGTGGVILFVVLLVVIFAAPVLLQRKKSWH